MTVTVKIAVLIKEEEKFNIVNGVGLDILTKELIIVMGFINSISIMGKNHTFESAMKLVNTPREIRHKRV